jgi:hypothetical protein
VWFGIPLLARAMLSSRRNKVGLARMPGALRTEGMDGSSMAGLSAARAAHLSPDAPLDAPRGYDCRLPANPRFQKSVYGKAAFSKVLVTKYSIRVPNDR